MCYFLQTCQFSEIQSHMLQHLLSFIVLGQKSPSTPVDIRYTNTTHTTATIEWRISTITYTPENYQVEYGSSPVFLNGRSSVIKSGNNLKATNRLYSVTISGLSSNTTYYYRVLSSNSFSSTYTSLKKVVTISLCKLHVQNIDANISILNFYISCSDNCTSSRSQ